MFSKYVSRNTVENVVIIIATVLMFQIIPHLPYIGEYINTYPMILLLAALVMLAFSGRIVDTITIVPEQTVKGLLAIFISFMFFNAIPRFTFIKNYIQTNTLVFLVAVILLITFKDKISELIGG